MDVKFTILSVEVTVNDKIVHIQGSSEIHKRSTMRSILNQVRFLLKFNKIDASEWFINKKSINNMIFEWCAHNLLYNLGICKDRTKDVDLNYHSWWYSLGYFVLSLFYCW